MTSGRPLSHMLEGTNAERIIVAEIVHGTARGLLLVPLVGKFRSSQIGVLTGAIIILVIAYFADPERQHTPRRPVEEVIWQ